MASHSPVVCVVHTSRLSLEPFSLLFRELGPGVAVRHAVDPGLLDAVVADGEVGPATRERIRSRYQEEARRGCDLLFNPCSSVREAVEALAPELPVPVVQVDAAMARAACARGSRIGVLATLPTTLGPTTRLLERTAGKAQRDLRTTAQLVEGAFDALERGDRAEHDRRVARAAGELLPRVDVLVLAQGSMAPALAALADIGTPVFTSPRLGVSDALARLDVPC